MQLFSVFAPEATFWYALSLAHAAAAESPSSPDTSLSRALRQAQTLLAASQEPDFARRCCIASALSPDSLVSATPQAVRDLARETVAGHWPRLAAELPLRVRPFLELWEARGPGLLRQVQRRWNSTDPSQGSRVDSCHVLWVHPLQGGGGWCFPSQAAIAFEATLVNPVPAIPEPLRFAWLVLQAALGSQMLDLPSEIRLKQLALLPATLAAGEFVEWTLCDERHVTLAAQHWLGLSPASAAELAPNLLAWWGTCESQPRGDWQSDLQRLKDHLAPYFLES